ncbi:MAG: hypothetical protein JNL42_01665 [Anaerolineae bacterium]|nr:hypothetical protein [Anaerolineae bacterium]
MYVKINRNVCDHQLAICERCLGKFLSNPMGYERQCFEEIRDDGSDLLTLDLHTGDRDIRIELNEEQRKLMAGEGWASFVDFAVQMYRVTSEEPH